MDALACLGLLLVHIYDWLSHGLLSYLSGLTGPIE